SLPPVEARGKDLGQAGGADLPGGGVDIVSDAAEAELSAFGVVEPVSRGRVAVARLADRTDDGEPLAAGGEGDGFGGGGSEAGDLSGGGGKQRRLMGVAAEADGGTATRKMAA